MCRWLAYSGNPIPLSQLVFETDHSIIDQSLQARSSVQTTNGDGFGVGWYDDLDHPGMYKHIQPAWNDPNLRDLCEHTRSRMFLAHVRAATGTAIQQTNCHPFRFRNWLFVHNGRIREARRSRRRLMLEFSPDMFPFVFGTTDSELMFLLTLSFGLEDDPFTAVARMAGLVERIGRELEVEHPLQMTLGISDGARLHAVRYSSENRSRTLFVSREIDAIRQLAPPDRTSRLDAVGSQARAVVSEPFADLPGMWDAIPDATWVTVENGKVSYRDFAPIAA